MHRLGTGFRFWHKNNLNTHTKRHVLINSKNERKNPKRFKMINKEIYILKGICVDFSTYFY